MSGPFADLAEFTVLPRVTALAVSPQGRVVVAVDAPDEKVASYVSALWELDPDGKTAPRRLTWSEKGESSPAFLPDESLLFVSKRADDEDAVWVLPPGGEARLLARYPGGARRPVVATGSGAVVVSAARPVGADGDGAEARCRRKDRKLNAILHTGMPIRHWDHELGDTSPRLLLADPDGGAPVDLAPGANFELTNAAYGVSADGRTVATTWTRRLPHGRTQSVVAVVDVGGGDLRLLEPDTDAAEYSLPALAPDGGRVAVVRETMGTFDEPMTAAVLVLPADGTPGAEVSLDTGEVFPEELCWSPDGRTLYVAGDWRGRGAVLAFDVDGSRPPARLAADACYSNLCPSADGRWLYALRSSVNAPAHPVRLDVSTAEPTPAPIRCPGGDVELPGTVEEITATAPDGAEVQAWLCRPTGGSPAPLMLWVHGGPFSAWGSWSWRWNPWVAVARGWAVLLPNPALSTGFGPGWWARAWPHRAGEVWADLEAVLDATLQRDDVDAGRTACLGGSFGGYMTNWIAGHTDRFGAIVTHAGLWALDQQHATTDAAEWKTGLFGLEHEHPEWYAANSPNRFVDSITTPMLVIHGNRDYRVPVSEALRLWWDLVSRFDGPPDELPHRFLQFTGEHHWVLSPANAQVWYETVLDFCAQHVLGAPEARSALL